MIPQITVGWGNGFYTVNLNVQISSRVQVFHNPPQESSEKNLKYMPLRVRRIIKELRQTPYVGEISIRSCSVGVSVKDGYSYETDRFEKAVDYIVASNSFPNSFVENVKRVAM